MGDRRHDGCGLDVDVLVIDLDVVVQVAELACHHTAMSEHNLVNVDDLCTSIELHLKALSQI